MTCHHNNDKSNFSQYDFELCFDTKLKAFINNSLSDLINQTIFLLL